MNMNILLQNSGAMRSFFVLFSGLEPFQSLDTTTTTFGQCFLLNNWSTIIGFRVATTTEILS